MPQPLTPPPMIARSKIRSKRRFPGARPFVSAILLSVLIKSQSKAKARRKGKRAASNNRALASRSSSGSPRQRTSAHDVNAGGNTGDGTPVRRCRPLTENRDCHDSRHCRRQRSERSAAGGPEDADRASVENKRSNCRQKSLHDRLKRQILPWSPGETGTRHQKINRHIENQGADGGNARGVQPIEPRAAHCDRVAGPRHGRTKKKRVPDGLPGIESRVGAPGNAKDA